MVILISLQYRCARKFFAIRLIGLICLFALAPAVCAATTDGASSSRYALELPLTEKNAKKLKQRASLYRYQRLYLSPATGSKNGVQFLRIGFFDSEKEALDLLQLSAFLFEDQTLIAVDNHEYQTVSALANDEKTTVSDAGFTVFSLDPDSQSTMIQTLLNSAKNNYLDGNYSIAAGQYLALATFADDNTAAWATELRGLCFEKLGEPRKAIQLYRHILEAYPEASGVGRVTQRVRTMESAAEDGKQALKKSRYASNKNNRRVFARGLLGQYYRTLSRSVNGGENEEVLSTVSTDFDLRFTSQQQGHTFNARANGYWLYDQLVEEDSDVRLKRLFLEYENAASGVNVGVGRQKKTENGVFTSFDGVSLGWDISDDVSISASGGKPVYFSDFYENLDYVFYSANSHWNINDKWGLNAYYTTQTLNDITDREALGLRVFYNNRSLSTSLSVDYDLAFSEQNYLLWNGSYTFSKRLNISAVYGNQRSPFLSATNIFIGQADLNLETYLQSKENRDSIIEDALSRTSSNEYYTFTLNYQLDDSTRISFDYYNSVLSDIPSAEILTGLPSPNGIDNPSEYSQQTIGSRLNMRNLVSHNDNATIGLRHSQGTSSDSNQIYFSERINIGGKISINPKINYSLISFSSNADEQSQLRYSLQFSYRPFRNAELSLEAGNEMISVQQRDMDFDSNYLYLGYRVNF